MNETLQNVDVDLLSRIIESKSQKDGDKFLNEILSELLSIQDLSSQEIVEINNLATTFNTRIDKATKKTLEALSKKSFREYSQAKSIKATRIRVFYPNTETDFLKYEK